MKHANGDERRDRDDIVAGLLSLAGPRPAPPADVAARVKATVRAAWLADVRARRTRRRVLLVALPAAAGIVLAIAGSMWRRSPDPLPEIHPPASAVIIARLETAAGSLSVMAATGDTRSAGFDGGGPIYAGTTVVTGAAGVAAFRTPDGASLRVGASTRLQFLSATEWQLEHGVAYLDNPPSRGSRVQLSVRTSLATVRDVGTQFEVRADWSSLRLRVREGTASVERPTGNESASAGTELRVDASGRVERRAVPTHGPEWAWVTGLATPIEIEGRPLGEFLAWTAREMGWRLEYRDARLAQTAPAIILHGSLAGLTPSEALATVLATCGLASHVDAGVLAIEEASPGASGPVAAGRTTPLRSQARAPEVDSTGTVTQ